VERGGSAFWLTTDPQAAVGKERRAPVGRTSNLSINGGGVMERSR